MGFLNIKNATNDPFRKKWVENTISEVVRSIKSSNRLDSISLLDVGAGLSPFKEHIVSLGINYFSHDFNEYSPSNFNPGLHDVSWDYPRHDFNCDVLLIPSTKKFDLILCTEVLEHIPDPVSVFKKLNELVSDNGYIIITVPFLSLKHQAPFWFSSGLSDYWFEFWAKELGLNVVDLAISGDYIDLMSQEIYRLFNFNSAFRFVPFILSKLVKLIRPLLKDDVLTSGGFNTLFVAKK